MPMITPALRNATASQASANMAPASASSSTATLGPQSLPPLTAIPSDAMTVSRISTPVKKIASEEDVAKWTQSDAYATYLLFVQRVGEACVGKATRLPPPPASQDTPKDRFIYLLYELNKWTDEIEPHAKPQRFGNLAFRDWGVRLADRVDELHTHLLPDHLHPFIPELKAYLLDGFGSFTRVDYGSGHEMTFFAWVCFLYRIGFFSSTASSVGEKVEDVQVEEAIGLEIFPLYLMVVWRLQDRYGLEPAGSHGVWGLDDFQFLPYVIGAAQLRLQSSLRPNQIVAASSHTSILKDQLGSHPNPAALISTSLSVPTSLLTSPDDGDVVIPNLYLTSLLRVQVLKRGPFHEHSPLLHDISTTVPNWVKVYTGMLKMYCAECIGKKVVVQHFAFGGVGWVWKDVPVAAQTAAAAGGRVQGMALGGPRGNMGSMGVPTTRMTAPGTGLPRGIPGSTPSAGGARLGHALGLGSTLGGGRPAMVPPATRAVPLTETTFPPVQTRAPFAKPNPDAQENDKEQNSHS